jgi:hypothetical protein
MAETLKDRLKRWTELVTVARTFVIALVALVAALAALGSGVGYLNKVLHQIAVNKEQTKASAVILADDIDKVNKSVQQNHADIVALNEYILTLNETKIDQALAPASAAVQAPKPPAPIWPRTGQDAGAAPPPPVATSVAPLASSRDGDGIPDTKRRKPPQPGPPPAPIDPTKATDVFTP